MRSVILTALVLTTGLVLAETQFSKSGDGLVKTWSRANTPRKRKAAMAESDAALRRQIGAQNPQDIAAAVRVLGAIYAWDYDPLNDTLSLFRGRLKEPEFRRAFEDEVARLPADQRAKLSDGLERLSARPTCHNEGEKYVCSDDPPEAK